MPDLANPFPLRIEEADTSPAVPAESIPNDLMNYVTPPTKNVHVMTVRYGEAKRGTPMLYDLKINS